MYYLEVQAFKSPANVGSISRWIWQGWNFLISAITNHESNALDGTDRRRMNYATDK